MLRTPKNLYDTFKAKRDLKCELSDHARLLLLRTRNQHFNLCTNWRIVWWDQIDHDHQVQRCINNLTFLLHYLQGRTFLRFLDTDKKNNEKMLSSIRHRAKQEYTFMSSPLARDGTVSRHRLWRHLEVAVAAIEEALSSLWQSLQHQACTRRGATTASGATVQRWGAIFHVETVGR